MEGDFIVYHSSTFGIAASTTLQYSRYSDRWKFLGEASLAAVGAYGVLTMAFLALANGFSAEAGILIAQRFRANQRKELRQQASSSFLLLLGMGLLATVLAIVISRFSLEHILVTPKSLLSLAEGYFQVYALGLFFQFGYNIVAALLRGIGDSKPPYTFYWWRV